MGFIFNNLERKQFRYCNSLLTLTEMLMYLGGTVYFRMDKKKNALGDCLPKEAEGLVVRRGTQGIGFLSDAAT
jgi:hypothetical protein